MIYSRPPNTAPTLTASPQYRVPNRVFLGYTFRLLSPPVSVYCRFFISPEIGGIIIVAPCFHQDSVLTHASPIWVLHFSAANFFFSFSKNISWKYIFFYNFVTFFTCSPCLGLVTLRITSAVPTLPIPCFTECCPPAAPRCWYTTLQQPL